MTDIELAVQVMDELKPGWWMQIDPLKLDLEDSMKCICGQNGIGWAGVNFDYRCRGGQDAVFSSREFEPLWLEEIAKRVPAPDREKVLV